MKYRSRYEIYNLILENAMTGASQAKIIFQVSISSEQAEAYLRFLQGCKLISEPKRHFFKTTEKGIKFISRSDEMRRLITM